MPYVVDRSVVPAIVLPEGMNLEGCMDVTRVGDSFRRFYNPRTGIEINCADYHAEMMAELRELNRREVRNADSVAWRRSDTI